MTIEEKAKAYDGNYKVYTELINRLEDVKEAIKKQNYGIAMDILYKPYPEFQITTSTELKESEDEKIRKELIKFVKVNIPDEERYIAWLEKQGEDKHLELKAGKWYICYRAYCCRADNLTVKEGERILCERDGVVKGFVIKDPEKYFKEISITSPIEKEQSYIDTKEATHEGWINIKRIGDDPVPYVEGVYESKSKAKEIASIGSSCANHIATLKIEWEE